MKKIILIAVLFSCTDSDRARQALVHEGMTHIHMTGYQVASCGDDDTCTGFVALDARGHKVTGAVGCGWDFGGCGKGCTVRFD